MPIVPFYAAVLGLLFFALSIRTILMRRRLRVAIGDAGNPAMLRAMRVHSNFAEYAPLALLLIYFVEVTGASPLHVHALSLCLLAGRVSHAYGVSQARENFRFRVFGMVMTFTALISAAVYLLLAYAIAAA